ncbi:MAG: YdcF family protein [Actinomycetota bacterium]
MGAARRHPVLALVVTLLLGVAVLVGVTFGAVWRAAHEDDASQIERVDAIVVLGAAQYDGQPSPVFAARLEQARLLYRQHRAGTVIVLGGSRAGDISTEAHAGRGYLLRQGLPSDAVVAEPVGRTTYESLRAAAAYMKDHGMRTAFLVSDPWHNLRIKRMASDLGIEGYVSATWHSAARSEPTRLQGYVRETFAYLHYRVFGR